VRLLLDEMYPRRLAEELRSAGHDVVAVVELPELIGRPDADVAHWARDEGRVVVTENVADFASLDVTDHGGLLFVNARRWRRTRSALPRLTQALDTWLGRRGDAAPVVEWL
jgi:hypothetical protein